MLTRREYLLRGVVQGVGFRPHVAVVAARHRVTGLVGNDDRQVFLEAQATVEGVEAFVADLLATLPPLARVIAVSHRELPLVDEDGFRIVASRQLPGVRTLIPPDVATCADCLAEMADPTNRRYGYAFTTCTNCGPRLTIIEDLPYDRPATTMRAFEMCPACRAEYTDPTDRRFHAQPISCFDCGPVLWLQESPVSAGACNQKLAEPVEAPAANPSTSSGNLGKLAEPVEAPVELASQGAVVAEARSRLQGGKILAVKGLGGFHLMCDARNAEAVARLRERKRRPGKPFAVMVADAAAASRLAELSPDQLGQLTSPARPILIAPMTEAYDLDDGVAPGLRDVGLMLPYTPLHTLLLATGMALVATSGNLSEEPLCFTNADALARLAHLADAFLLHDRDIHVPVEDSVMLALPGADALPIRRSRGHAPLPVLLPTVDSQIVEATPQTPAQPTQIPAQPTQIPAQPPQIPELVEGSTPIPPVVLAVGGELKNTFALAIEDMAFVSAHVGDMGSLASQQAFEASVAQLVGIHRREPQVLVCDLHPGYATTGWAQRYAEAHPGVRLLRVQHHYAHALSLLAEYGIASGPVVVATLDGTGYGTDGTIWGGEILTLGAGGSSPANWERTWHVPTFALVGGDRAIRQPWRIAQGIAHSWGLDVTKTPASTAAPTAELRLVASQLASGQGVVATSSAGRLFDAAAAILGLCLEATYEAQAAMALERAAAEWARTAAISTLRPLDPQLAEPVAPLRQAQGTGVTQETEPQLAEPVEAPDPQLAEPVAPLRQAQGTGVTQKTGVTQGTGVTQETEPKAAEPVEAFRPGSIVEVFDELLTHPQRAIGERAWRFHVGLASVFADQLAVAAATADTTTVGLTGGVMVNRIFISALVAALEGRGLTVLTHRVVPPTDGGLSLGQVWAGRLLNGSAP